jgi:hypothetical protein
MVILPFVLAAQGPVSVPFLAHRLLDVQLRPSGHPTHLNLAEEAPSKIAK